MRFLRLLPLLLACSLAPAVLAQSADLSVTVTMPSTAVYYAVSPFSVAVNKGPSPASEFKVTLTARQGTN
jgi:hypothetical protein